MLESQAFKDYEKAIETFRASEEFRDYYLAKFIIFQGLETLPEEVTQEVNSGEFWKGLKGDKPMDPHDIKDDHERLRPKIYTYIDIL